MDLVYASSYSCRDVCFAANTVTTQTLGITRGGQEVDHEEIIQEITAIFPIIKLQVVELRLVVGWGAAITS